jgi:hypothetical protein
MLTQLDSVRELLRQCSAVVEGAISVGIEDIPSPRRVGNRTREVIEAELDRARASAERGSRELSEADFRRTNLFADTHKSINRILLLQQEKTKRHATRFELSVRFVSFSTLWAVCTQHVAFVEFYHVGQPAPDAWLTGSYLGENVPVLRVRAGADLYNIIRSHIGYLFAGENGSLSAIDVSTMAEQLQSDGVWDDRGAHPNK